MDMQRVLIDKAEQRLKEKRGIKFPSIFIAGDVGDKRNTIDKILERCTDIKKTITFDIVSCQFSLHYLYESEERLNTFLHNVSCRMAKGGFFIGTIIDGDKVLARIRTQKSNSLKISNDYYSI